MTSNCMYVSSVGKWEVSDEGDVSFTCQHGPRECTGNLYQACLLDKLDDNEKEVDAVTCIMDATFPDVATESVSVVAVSRT